MLYILILEAISLLPGSLQGGSDMLWVDRIPDCPHVKPVTLPPFGEGVREVLGHVRLGHHLVIDAVDSELIEVWRLDGKGELLLQQSLLVHPELLQEASG